MQLSLVWTEFPHHLLHVSLVIVHDCVDAVSYSEDGAIGKLCADGILDEAISLQIHGCRSLIQYQNLGLTQKSSCQTHQLTLADTGGLQNSGI